MGFKSPPGHKLLEDKMKQEKNTEELTKEEEEIAGMIWYWGLLLSGFFIIKMFFDSVEDTMLGD